MFVVMTRLATQALLTCHRLPRRGLALLVAMAVGSTALLIGGPAGAAIVPTVPLGTAAQYAVLAGSTVTNTGNTVVNGSVGLWPGTSVTGFPPGIVNPPGTIDVAPNAVAQQAQSDLTTAYDNAAGRPLNATTTADLVNLTLVGGVYAGPGKGALQLTGPLTLDGQGDPTSVFIFQTNTSLTTASSSTITLINGAQECNVFWQVGSSATLGTSSVFRGNLLALTSISLGNAVTVHGRTLARNGGVTLINDTFVRPSCDLTPPSSSSSSSSSSTSSSSSSSSSSTSSSSTSSTSSSTSSIPASTTTLAPGATTSTLAPGATTSTLAPGATTSTLAPGATTSTLAPGATTSTLVPGATTSTLVPGATTSTLVPGATTSTLAPGATTSTLAPGATTSVDTTGATGAGGTARGGGVVQPELPRTGPTRIALSLELAMLAFTLGALALYIRSSLERRSLRIGRMADG